MTSLAINSHGGAPAAGRACALRVLHFPAAKVEVGGGRGHCGPAPGRTGPDGARRGSDTDTASAEPALPGRGRAIGGTRLSDHARADHAPRSRVRPCPAPWPLCAAAARRRCLAVETRLCLFRGNKCSSHPGCLETARVVGVVPRTNSTTLPKRCR